MQRGDLSNVSAPSIVIVFEEAIGRVPEELLMKFQKEIAKNRWYSAVDYYALNEPMLRKMMDLAWRQNINIRIVTWTHPDAVQAIQEIMDEENVPVREVFYTTPERLARELAYRPDIIKIYDPDPAHRFTYGGKGEILTDYNQLGRL